MKTSVYVEFYGEQISQDELVAEVKKIWEASGKKASDLKSIALYVKPEEDKAYYVINGDETGSFTSLTHRMISKEIRNGASPSGGALFGSCGNVAPDMLE
ncbi:MAG: hypothetical protein IJM25_00575 [Eubacterium sp.]|nr:hypothetical protein [Eubacterium sp.]